MDFAQIGPLLIGIAGFLYAFLTESKYRTLRGQLVDVAGHIADGTAFIYDRARMGKGCDPETLSQVAVKAGEIWTDLATLGPAVEALLNEKSSLAEVLQRDKK